MSPEGLLTSTTGANILLAYFHYCNKGLYPFSKNCKESDLQNLAELDESSLEFVRWTRRYIEDHSKLSPPRGTALDNCLSDRVQLDSPSKKTIRNMHLSLQFVQNKADLWLPQSVTGSIYDSLTTPMTTVMIITSSHSSSSRTGCRMKPQLLAEHWSSASFVGLLPVTVIHQTGEERRSISAYAAGRPSSKSNACLVWMLLA